MNKFSIVILFLFSVFGYSQNGNSGSFQPLPSGKYIVSGWVKEGDNVQKKTYESTIVVSFESSSMGNTAELVFPPSGEIIDGWQRIVGILEVPSGYEDGVIVIKLNCKNRERLDCFFDDIRFLPYNGNLKSFVYDSDNSKLMAELDENNYATFYEYDQEGGLIRVKKETEKGIMTIQESRSSNAK